MSTNPNLHTTGVLKRVARLSPVSEPAGFCGLPRDGLPAATMRAARAGRGRVGPTPVRCISPDDDGKRCSFFLLGGPVLSTPLDRTAEDERRRSPGPPDLQETMLCSDAVRSDVSGV